MSIIVSQNHRRPSHIATRNRHPPLHALLQVIVRQPDKDGRVYYFNGGDARGRWKSHPMPIKKTMNWKMAGGFASTHLRVDRGF